MLVTGGYAAVAVMGLGLLSAWTLSYVNNRLYVGEVAQRVEKVRELVQATPNRSSPDLLPILPALAARPSSCLRRRASRSRPNRMPAFAG